MFGSVISFSTSRYTSERIKSDDSTFKDIEALAIFSDADTDKLDILNFIKGKSGIYMWTNKLNGKKYVGSSLNLRRRLLEYYNANRLLNEKSMPIYSALLKHGYHYFSFTILVLCDKNNLVSIEKHFFDVYSPEYNILKTPGSPDRGSGWKHSEAAMENIRIAAKKRAESTEYLAKLSASQSSGIKVEVTDVETNTSTTYHAIQAAARALSIDKRYIEHYIYLSQEKPVLDKYTFKFIHSEVKPNLYNSPSVKIQKTYLKIEVTNIESKEVTLYPSIGAAARELGYHQASISLYLKENRTKPFKGLYLIKKV